MTLQLPEVSTDFILTPVLWIQEINLLKVSQSVMADGVNLTNINLLKVSQLVMVDGVNLASFALEIHFNVQKT